MPELPSPEADVLSFGPFTLKPRERLLLRGAETVDVGARAFDILAALAASPNEPVGKNELLARVWPDMTVGEGSLRFHMANLRKALGDGRDGARYITTLPGRGYCFVATVARVRRGTVSSPDPARQRTNMPNRPPLVLGREEDSRTVRQVLASRRFVTIVGPGGVGKSTLALDVAHDLASHVDGAVLFVDLSMLGDADLVAVTVASMLGVQGDADDVAATVIEALRGNPSLVVFDTCEHVIDAVAIFAGRLFAETSDVLVLATSREPLKVEGEQVYRLAPLACPDASTPLTADAICRSPATRLFTERAVSSGVRLATDEAAAALIADICRKLDGIPLAIELAARRVEAFGLERTAALLQERLSLTWTGARDAPARQRTLHATLDWSFGLLAEQDRTVLRRLAVFVGSFTVDAALAVCTDESLGAEALFASLDSLVAKSMVAARPVGAMVRYRLLDTTRAFMLQSPGPEADRSAVSTRHARHVLAWLEETGAEWSRLSNVAERARHLSGLANLRAALDWCFGEHGDPTLGRRLAAKAGPVFLAMSLLSECHRWTERALATLDPASRGTRDEMHLQSALGVSLMFTRGGTQAACEALVRSLDIADEAGASLDQVQVLGSLQMFHLRTGAFRVALRYAERCVALADSQSDPGAAAMARSILGMSFHFAGEHGRARTELEAALAAAPRSKRTSTLYLGLDGHVLAGAIMARTLWLQGYPDQAVDRARRTIAEAAAMDHALSLCIALGWGISVFDWVGDLPALEEHVDRFISRSAPNAFAPYLEVGRGWRGVVAIRRGETAAGVAILEESLAKLHAMPYELLSMPLTLALILGLMHSGRSPEARALVIRTMEDAETHGDLCSMPELLRMKALLALEDEAASRDRAKDLLRQSLALARQQGARGWELRAASSLAALRAEAG
ncbi:transcriptional regulator [Alsobacter metallidurans]|uniref:Transcriptional regulator n=1 Tax=Alsobacter metallidurans TaxID=340221 RepID=A0A917MJJ1_9HYPH|nr:winged helix-turn-helix domain-containing protein [Alsobacter metallidurans]GGH31792.1 transcriptional regulator [Alsobacter metallidurans]